MKLIYKSLISIILMFLCFFMFTSCNNKDEQLLEFIEGSSVKVEINIIINKEEEYKYDCMIVREVDKKKLSDYLTDELKSNIRKETGLIFKENKLYEINDNYNEIEYEFNNSQFISSVSVWAKGQYDIQVFVNNIMDILAKPRFVVRKPAIFYYLYNPETNTASGDVIDTLFKDFVSQEGITITIPSDCPSISKYDPRAVWNKTTGVIEGYISTNEKYTTSTSVSEKEIIDIIYNLLSLNQVFTSENIGATHEECKFYISYMNEDNPLLEFRLSIVIDEKVVYYFTKRLANEYIDIRIDDIEAEKMTEFYYYN